MRVITTSTGAEIALDGDLLAMLETLFREVTARKDLDRTFEDMMREIGHLADQLSAEDLRRPEVVRYGTDVETAVVHYGDTTLTFMNNWYRADQRGNPYAYTSAAAVEEKSVIDYNTGNPDGVLQQGEQPRPPRVPLVAIYPEEGTLYSDNPLIVLDAEWVDADEPGLVAVHFRTANGDVVRID